MARTRIRNVKLNEISFVGKGDNPEADVLLLKMKKDPAKCISAMPKDMKDEDVKKDLLTKWLADNAKLVQKEDGEAETFDEIVQDKVLRDQVWSMCWTLEDSIGSIIRDDTVSDKTAMIQQSIDQFKAAITALTKGEKEMPELKKAKEDLATAQAKIADLEKQVGDLTTENTVLKTDKGALEQKVTTLEKSANEDPIFKGMTPEAVAIIKSQREDIEKMKDDNLQREYISKAAGVELVGAAGDVGPLLKTIATKVDTATADKVFDLLKTANTRIAEGDLLKEKGKTSTGTGITALDKLTKKAEEYKAANPTVTKEKAFQIVYDTEHDLRKQYNEETNRR